MGINVGFILGVHFFQKKTLHFEGRKRQLGSLSQMTGRNIMAAILQTKGPVVTAQVVKNVWRFLHMMTSDQYNKACKELEGLNLGTLVTLSNVRKASVVFVKRAPAEALPIIEMNQDLCSLEYYESRYNQPVSKSISLNMRHGLAKMGVLSPKQLIN